MKDLVSDSDLPDELHAFLMGANSGNDRLIALNEQFKEVIGIMKMEKQSGQTFNLKKNNSDCKCKTCKCDKTAVI